MGQRKKALYSEEFQAMLDKLEEEDYADRSEGHFSMKKNRLCLQKVKALEKHFEVENKLQPERKVKIAEELGLEPRQVAVWFQNRRARWKTKHLEREYDCLLASYDSLKRDYGFLEQEKTALLVQLKELKGKIESRTQEMSNTSTTPLIIQAPLNYDDISKECSASMNNVPFSVSSSSVSSSSRTFDPFPMVSSSSTVDGFQLCRSSAYQNQLMRMEELGMFNHEELCNNMFSFDDQAPTLQWYDGDNSN